VNQLSKSGRPAEALPSERPVVITIINDLMVIPALRKARILQKRKENKLHVITGC
jgi:hypothetical protein